jgi:hypothetical protein
MMAPSMRTGDAVSGERGPDPMLAVHHLPRHPERVDDLGHRHTSPDLQHRPVTPPQHAQLHQHPAECHASTEPNL